MKYITSKKSFPIDLLHHSLVEKAIRNRHGAMYLYEDGDKDFRVRARDFEYQDIMKELKLASEIYENQVRTKTPRSN